MKAKKDPDYVDDGEKKIRKLDASKRDAKSRSKRDKSYEELKARGKVSTLFDGATTANDPNSRYFPDLVEVEDAKNRPLYVCPDGHIFLETFSPFYKQAYDFLISIAEPVSRPKFIHEYQITPYSIFAAVSIGLTAEEIIRVLGYLSKCKIPERLIDSITTTVRASGKLRLILQDNRYFIESSDVSLLHHIANDEVIGKYRIEERHPDDIYDDDNGFIVVYDENQKVTIAGIGEQVSARDTIMDGLKMAPIEPVETGASWRFEVNGHRVRDIRARAVKGLHLPFTNEYDWRADTRIPNLNIDIKQATSLRPYQEKALNKMFSGGRAISGVIVLPCGAGKTLVGVTAACTIGKSTIVFCNGSVPVHQWYRQFGMWTTMGDKGNMVVLTSKNKKRLPPKEEACILITTYSMITHNGHRSEETEYIMEQIRKREWGLMVMDEVQEMPAETFSTVVDIARAHVKLGLTATLVREDDKINELNHLIGPKLYEANWMDLGEQGFIARVKCYEVWCKMTGEFYRQYLMSNHLPKRRLYSAMNPNKLMTVQRLIEYHESRGDKILVFSDILWVLKKYKEITGKPILYGDTNENEREAVLERFRTTNKVNVILISRIGDKAIDLPDANVLIQICSHFGSRMQEAQRLGRILRAKPGRTDEYNAFFYTLISEDTKEMYYSRKRQDFLVNQGYSFEVVQDAEERWPSRSPLKYALPENQKALLEECRNSDDTDGSLEKDDDDDRMQNDRRSKRKDKLTGARR